MNDDSNKRVRDDDESPDSPHRVDSPESKIRRVELVSDGNSNSNSSLSESDLTRVDSVESVLDSDVHLQDDILNMLDDTDNVPERDSVLGLDSVIKSFEDEILASGLDPGLVEVSGSPGELLPENLGYLLEASDDELGLPPTVAPDEEPGRVGPEGVDLTGFVGFEDDVPSYDEFGFGAGWPVETDGTDAGDGGFVTGDGLFDYAEPAGDVLWRSESLQAM